MRQPWHSGTRPSPDVAPTVAKGRDGRNAAALARTTRLPRLLVGRRCSNRSTTLHSGSLLSSISVNFRHRVRFCRPQQPPRQRRTVPLVNLPPFRMLPSRSFRCNPLHIRGRVAICQQQVGKKAPTHPTGGVANHIGTAPSDIRGTNHPHESCRHLWPWVDLPIGGSPSAPMPCRQPPVPWPARPSCRAGSPRAPRRSTPPANGRARRSRRNQS
jgi:hypothetical protein